MPAILLLLLGGLSGRRMSTDILPAVNIPAINVIRTYQGLNPQGMALQFYASPTQALPLDR